MFTWQTMWPGDGRIETVDSWATLGEVIWEMACWSWEEPTNGWLSYVVDAAGLVVATAIYGPDGALLVTLSDGRRFCFPVPETYRAAVCGDEMANSHDSASSM